MKTFISDGDTLTFIADSNGVESGQGVLYGSLFGVACTDADAAEEYEAQVTGIFDLPNAGDDIAAGAAIYWTGTACTTTPGGSLIGAAVEASASSDASVKVRLNGIAIVA